MTSSVRRWRSAALVTFAAAGIAVITIAGGNWGVGIALTVLLLAYAWLVSPLLCPRSPDWATAQQLARERGVPLILWKPACTYCIRLRLALGRAGSRAVWVDIWADDDAAAATRELNNGNETTPTVVTSEGAHTNPPASVVKAQLQLI
jgi:mycoredoxin